MKEKMKLRVGTVLLVLFFAVQAFGMTACADDEEMLGYLPGPWTFTAYLEEQVAGEETPEADLAFLTLEENGEMSLVCYGKDGEYVCTCEGSWSFELITGGMDRLTLLFTSSDGPFVPESGYRAECVFDVYAEGWVENDTEYTYLILEETEDSDISPFEEVYGEDGEPPVALHRDKGPNMRVANCKDWVSLREKRSKSSARLAKVPLGAAVLAYPEIGDENGFILCVYQDEYGYILSEYLEPIEEVL